MSHKNKPSVEKKQILDEIISGKTPELFRNLLLAATEHILQESLEKELSDYLGRSWYSRESEKSRIQSSIEEDSKKDYRNGYVNRQVRTTEGVLNIKRPRLRKEGFKSQIIARLASIEAKLFELSVESYTRGLSTRDIEDTFTDQSGDKLLSRSGASELAKDLHKQYEEFSRRDLSELDPIYLFVDGVYESVKRYTNKQAILCAWAICSDGTKQLIHMMAVKSESVEAYLELFNDMQNRGLRQPMLVVSDGSKSVISAIATAFPRAQRQRCITHKMRNIETRLPEVEESKTIKEQIRTVYYAPNESTARYIAGEIINKYAEKYPSAIKCFTDDLDACLTHLKYPEGHRIFIRTTNLIERTFVEEKRRTKVIGQHNNEKGCLGLVFGVLIRVSKKWRKVKMSEYDLAVLRKIRAIILPHDLEFSNFSYKLVM